MINEDAVFQRTETGGEEIRRKTHGLTQSERLVLILIDGVTDVKQLRLKLKGLTVDRYDRALNKLIRTGLVQELLLAAHNHQAEIVDETVAQRFLRQDPLDPVTITSSDPEDEFQNSGDLAPAANGASAATAHASVDLHLWKSNSAAEVDPFPRLRTESRIVPPREPKLFTEDQRPAKATTPPPAAPREFKRDDERPPTPVPMTDHMRDNKPPVNQDGSNSPRWLYWIGLLLISLLTALFVLMY